MQPIRYPNKGSVEYLFILLLGIQISDLATEPQPICVVQEMGESSILAVSWSTAEDLEIVSDGMASKPRRRLRYDIDTTAMRHVVRHVANHVAKCDRHDISL
jgi:hypothetical protein